MHITELKLKGDTDNEYTISIKDGNATCSCPDFRFRAAPDGACKHMRFVLGLVAAKVEVAS